MIKRGKKTNLIIDFGSKQYCARGGELCSNSYKHFYDARGHFVMILSDGMGDDDRAAAGSRMTTDFLGQSVKDDVEYNKALEILNSSLLQESIDESLATVDIARIDLCTGFTAFYKAGAAPSVLRQNKKIRKIESTSLPAGVLKDIGFDITRVKCRIGDIIVLVSDGAISKGFDRIKNEVVQFRGGKAQDLAERLCICARQQATDDCENDITILCAILKKRTKVNEYLN